MGEARRRGTYEERVRQAIARQNAEKLNAVGVPMQVARRITKASAAQPTPSPCRAPSPRRARLAAMSILGLLSGIISRRAV